MHADNSLFSERHTQKLDLRRGKPRVTPVTRALPVKHEQTIA